jgi:hypothetical protein
MWWIKQPAGRVQQLGIRAGEGTLDIPALTKGVISVKLRAKAASDTVVYLGENVAVGGKATFIWP